MSSLPEIDTCQHDFAALPFSLRITSELQSLADEFAKAPVNWDRIAELYCDYILFGKEGRTCENNLCGIVGELHLRSFLESAQAKNPAIKLNPIPFGTKVGSFVFNEGRLGSYQLALAKSGRGVAEYDMITAINGLPVIWEVKMGLHAKGAYAHTRIRQLLSPIHSHFQSPGYAYVVVLPKGHEFSEETALKLKDILTVNMSQELAEFQASLEKHKSKFDWRSYI